MRVLVRANPPFGGRNVVEMLPIRPKPRYTGREAIETSSSKSLWQPMCHRTRMLIPPCQSEFAELRESAIHPEGNAIHGLVEGTISVRNGRARPRGVFAASGSKKACMRSRKSHFVSECHLSRQAWVKAIVWEMKKDYICGLY